MSTFVSVGTAYRPFNRLLDAVAELAPTLPQPVVVQSGHTPFTARGCIVIPFMPMEEYEASVTRARLVIMQAGGGGVIQSIRAGKMPVVMPRRAIAGESVDDHQIVWARELARIGKAIIVEEPHELTAAVAKALSLISQETKSEPRMIQLVREALQRLGQCD